MFRELIVVILVHRCSAVADPQSLLEEKEALQEKLSITEYELRLAQEDTMKVKTELQKKTESHPVNSLSGKLLNPCCLK